MGAETILQSLFQKSEKSVWLKNDFIKKALRIEANTTSEDTLSSFYDFQEDLCHNIEKKNPYMCLRGGGKLNMHSHEKGGNLIFHYWNTQKVKWNNVSPLPTSVFSKTPTKTKDSFSEQMIRRKGDWC